MSHRTALLITTAVVALSFGSLSADAAMPVSGVAKVDAGGIIVQAQATTTTPATSTTPATGTAQTAAPSGGQPKAKAKKTSSRQKEIDSSVQSGTVPKRYMKNVPKQYHDLIPWSK